MNRGNKSIIASLISAVGLIIAALISIQKPHIPDSIFSPNKPFQSVEFSIYDHLGSGQISESLTIIINGEMVGTISVDTFHPSAVIKVKVPKPGQHSYTISASTVFMDSFGNRIRLQGGGQGTVFISGGEEFSLVGTINGSQWLITLQKM
jgi:hypothetical protein